MTEWAAFDLVRDNLLTYYTGSFLILAMAAIIIVILVLLSLGLDVRYALAFSLPLLGGFALDGWLISLLGAPMAWIIHLVLILLGLFVGWVLIKIAT